MEFGKKLDFLMNMTNTTNSVLAHYTSLDASYISRLRREKRGLPKNAVYVKSMATYFIKHCREDYQKKALCELLNNDTLNQYDKYNAEELLYNWLIENTKSTEKVDRFLDEFPLFQSKKQSGIDLKNNIKCDFTNNEIQIYYGLQGKRESVIEFLSSVVNTKSLQTLHLFSDENVGWLGDDEEFLKQWKSLMSQVISQGNKIKIIHTVSRNLDEMLTAIKGWMPLYMTGAIEPYYYPKKRDGIFKRTLFIAPKTAALVSTSVGNMEDSIPSSLIFDKKAVEGFKKEYDNYLAHCKPLMQIFTSENKYQYYETLQEFEKKEASTIIKSGGLSIFTMPQSLVESIAPRIRSLKADTLMDYHKNKVLTFKKNIENHRFVEIIRLPAMGQITDGMAKIGFSYTFCKENIYYTIDEYKKHLENIVYLLQSSNNYHIYFDEKEDDQRYTFYAKEDIGIMVGKESDSSVFVEIDESNITGAFWDYMNYEMNLTQIDKTNKDIVILKLKEIILKLSS